MTKKRRAHDEQAWMNARTICRLTPRQVKLARALGMNPKKLPRLRPSPQQHWKLPVGEFIEELYFKRFGGDPHDDEPHGWTSSGRARSAIDPGADYQEATEDRTSQVSDLVGYLVNLADDLQQWLHHGSIAADVVLQVRSELQEVATALETGASISPVPAIPVPPHRARQRSPRQDDERLADDDEIPF
jgi:hypothetical protein